MRGWWVDAVPSWTAGAPPSPGVGRRPPTGRVRPTRRPPPCGQVRLPDDDASVTTPPATLSARNATRRRSRSPQPALGETEAVRAQPPRARTAHFEHGIRQVHDGSERTPIPTNSERRHTSTHSSITTRPFGNAGAPMTWATSITDKVNRIVASHITPRTRPSRPVRDTGGEHLRTISPHSKPRRQAPGRRRLLLARRRGRHLRQAQH